MTKFGFAALIDESEDSDVESTCSVPTGTKAKVSSTAESTQDLVAQLQQQQQQSTLQNLQWAEEAGEFCAVQKKKGASGVKVSAAGAGIPTQKQQNPENPAAPLANGNHAANGRSNVTSSAVHQTLNSPIHLKSSEQAGPRSPAAKNPKKKGANRFACLDDSDASEASDHEAPDEYAVVAAAPALPKQVGLTNSPAVPDYFAVTTIQTTLPGDDAKKFKPEVLYLSILFVSSKTKKVDFDFCCLVQPFELYGPKKLTQQTVDATGITEAILMENNAQPLDEVMRHLERFMKEKNLVSAHRNKKKASKFAKPGFEFVMVTFGKSCFDDELRVEMLRKNLQPPIYFKKWIDIKKLALETLYPGEESDPKNYSLNNLLEKVCLEFEGKPVVDDGPNLAKIVSLLVADVPEKLVSNVNSGA